MSATKRNRPAGNGTESQNVVLTGACSNGSSIPEPAQSVLDGALVITVVTTIAPDQQRRRIFYTIKSAERAVQRAALKGHHADIVLCRLEPVQVVA